MVVDADVERPAGLGDPPCGLDIAPAGGRVAGRVIVGEDQCRRSDLERPPHDLAGIDRGLAHRAVGVGLVMEQPVAAVQEQNPQPLGREQRHVERQIVDELLRIVQRRAGEGLGAERVEHRVPDDPEMPDGRRPVAERPGLSRRSCGQGPGQRPEFGD